MNNITFGDEGCGYYETVAGGSGAVSTVIYHKYLALLLVLSARLAALQLDFLKILLEW